MQQRVTIITIVLVSLIVIGAAVFAIMATGSSYNKRNSELATNIETAQAKVDSLKASKDANDFTPTEVVESFFEEVKSDATAKAKLYLAPEAQNMDFKATLKLGSDLANITTGESLEETDGDNVNVSMTFVLADETTTVRVFALSQYDNVWKITGVTAE